jgi:hypothetical protein
VVVTPDDVVGEDSADFYRGLGADVASIDFAEVFAADLVTGEEAETLLQVVREGYLAYVEKVTARFEVLGEMVHPALQLFQAHPSFCEFGYRNSCVGLSAIAHMPMLQTLILDNSIFQSEALQELVAFARPGLDLSLKGVRFMVGEETADTVDLFETNLRHLEACGVKVDASIQYASEDPLPHNWVLQEAGTSQ